MDLLLFILFAAIAVACACNVVLQSHPVSSALSLVGVMMSLAVLYLLLGAEFISAAQVVVYAGAIMVLFIFVIMLLNAGAERRTARAKVAQFAGIPALILLGSLLLTLLQRGRGAPAVTFGGFDGGGAKDVGLSLFSKYLLPFEVTSLLILIALVGAVVLARKEID
jgi:NADH-quinone oxidoreductase subunit J